MEPFAPPGAESNWVEPMPAAPPVAPQVDRYGAADSFAPLPEASAFSGGTAGQAPDASADPLLNGDFDDSASGWHGSNSALTLVRGGVTGRAVRVLKANSRAAFAIVAGKPIASPKAGVRYRAGAFVRSVSPGMFVCLRVEEFGTAQTAVPVTTERCRARNDRLAAAPRRHADDGEGHQARGLDSRDRRPRRDELRRRRLPAELAQTPASRTARVTEGSTEETGDSRPTHGPMPK